jgi:hypothetical protein
MSGKYISNESSSGGLETLPNYKQNNLNVPYCFLTSSISIDVVMGYTPFGSKGDVVHL